MLRAAWDAPLQRDASHFVFMAAHIAKGHAPYWALWDTKNPLVELWWAICIAASRGGLSWAHASRLGESIWMGATAAGLMLLLRPQLARRGAGLWASAALASLAACVWLAWISSTRINDDGLSLSMYHALPELGVLAACVALTRMDTQESHSSTRHAAIVGVLLGCCVFAGWFVKQTSLVVSFAVVAGWLVFGARTWRIARVALPVAAGVALLGVACFAWHLRATNTWDVYIDSAITYKSRLAAAYPASAFWRDARIAIDPAPWLRAPLTQIATTTILAGTLAVGSLIALTWRRIRTRQALSAEQLVGALAVVWLVSVVAQAVLSLTFFRHYFLAALAPLVVCMVVGLAACRWSRGIAGVLGGVALLVLLLPAWGDAGRNRQRALDAPLTSTMTTLAQEIGPEERVLNWSGLLHYFTQLERTSPYPRNVWWPGIMQGVDEAQRTQRMRAVLAAGGGNPDVFIELYEDYPPEQALRPVRLTPELLHAWTGERYALVFETPAQSGRYAMPARVFRRVPASPPTIAQP